MTEIKGRVINLNGGVYQVSLTDGSEIFVKARGKLRSVKTIGINPKSLSKKDQVVYQKISPKVGDIITIKNDMIDEIFPRKNELIRPDIANVDQILLVFAAKEPEFSFYLLDLFIVNIIKQNIQPLIVITKIDKLEPEELIAMKQQMKYYTDLGYNVVFVCSKTNDGIPELKKYLENKTTVLSGQTGAGKSTLINALIPGFELQTQEISNALGRGKHTTRQTTLYSYNGGYIGDTPGFSKLNVLDIKRNELRNLFIDFSAYKCRFKDCLHQSNACGCGIKQAYEDKTIMPSRYENYLKMLEQIKEQR